MRIVYEGGVYEIMRTGGVARYFVDLIEHLPASVEPLLLAPAGVDLKIDHPKLQRQDVSVRPPLKLIRDFWRKSQYRALERATDRLAGDLIHWTYYVGLCRRPITRRGVANVITVYDFIHEAFPDLDRKGNNRRWQQRAIETADHVCCISQTTYDELCERYPAAAAKASVTLLGNTFRSVAAEPIPAELQQRPYVLFVGRRGGYKNFELLWNAWNRARPQCRDLALVAVGPPLKPREQQQLARSGSLDGLVTLTDVSDGQLKGLYQQSLGFVFPSRMEGFGLPALEAMECETPLLVSDCAALREVSREAAHYFHADDVDGLTDLLIALTRGTLSGRDEKIEVGRRRAEELSWNRTAEQTVTAYGRVLDRNASQHAA